MSATAQWAYSRPWWLPNTHLETVWARFFGRTPQYTRAIAGSTDGDIIAVDTLPGEPGKPVMAIFHGMEGCSRSHSVRQSAAYFNSLGWAVAVPHFRTCGVMNKLPRAYHAGDSADVDWMLRYVRAAFAEAGPLYACGISLGGNALAKWVGDNPGQQLVAAAVSVCAPLDLAAASRLLDGWFNRNTYGRHLLNLLKRKFELKLEQYPFLTTVAELRSIRTIRSFDDRFTAPLHGFGGVDDYYRQASALPALEAGTTPLLCLHSDNDAIIPVPRLPDTPYLRLHCTRGGGHSGYIDKPFPGVPGWLGRRIVSFCEQGA